MGDRESITVAEVSEGHGGSGDPGESVSLPVVELLTGRGFITGKSGSGKSNTASVVVENLLEASFPVLIVDIDGEYYGLKEKYEILHVGDDDECDIQVSPEHAEKIASLALEENVPIILDVSSYLDEDEARELLTAVARQLFAKEKKLKKPFLMLVEEVHEYLPEGAGLDECGKMLIKVGKRGRKHGLGIVGISQRPADVKKDFITQCDWLVWHRLTWNNDTNVVRRVLDGEYAEAVEDLDNGEGFLMTDWSETVRRVQFHRKQTFDAGATPGLEDFERPELKSVSDDLVSELQEISEAEQARENRIEELREELDRKNSRIAELEKELQDARDMQRMAEQFTDALLEHVQGSNPGLTEQERQRAKRIAGDNDAGGASPSPVASNGSSKPEAGDDDEQTEPIADETRPREEPDDGTAMTWPGADGTAPEAGGDAAETETPSAESGAFGDSDGSGFEEMDESAFEDADDSAFDDSDGSPFEEMEDSPFEEGEDSAFGDADESAFEDTDGDAFDAIDGEDVDGSGFDDLEDVEMDGFDADENASFGNGNGTNGNGTGDKGKAGGNASAFEPFDDSFAPDETDDDGTGQVGFGDSGFDDLDTVSVSDDRPEADAGGPDASGRDDTGSDAVGPDDGPDGFATVDAGEGTQTLSFSDISRELAGAADVPDFEDPRALVSELQSLDPQTRQMLRYYRNQGPGTPMDAHFAAGGDDDRTIAYARNRELRVRGFIEHEGRGKYAYRLPEVVSEVTDHEEELLARIERAFLATGDV